MKLALLILLFIVTFFAHGQILNAGFETGEASHWSYTPRPHYSVEVKGGKDANSMVIHSDTSMNEFQPFSQQVPIKKKGLYKVTLTVRLKSQNVSDNVGIWMHLQDSSENSLGSKNLKMTGVVVNGTTEWKNYSISLRSTKNAHSIVVGGHLSGVGTAYFDDFQLSYEKIIPAKPPLKVRRYEAHLRRKIQRKSIVSASIDWKKNKEEIQEILETVSNYDELDPINNHYLHLLRSHGDDHSFFPTPINEMIERKTTVASSNAIPSADIINDSTAYLYIPGFNGTQPQATQYATQINDLIAYIDTTLSISYWIIDLRHNHGGNMYPTLAGLSPFLGNRTLGYFTNGKNKRTAWKSETGKSGRGSLTFASVSNPHSLTQEAKKIAVLINEETASSGEITALSLKTLYNAALIGTPSRGHTTARKNFALKDGKSISLATSYIRDIHGNAIRGSLSPQYFVEDSLNEIDWVETTMLFFNGK